jgi:hypothetical protein
LDFSEVESHPALSTVTQFARADMHGALRDEQRVYQMRTVSLVDLLGDHGAPREIGYLSIDTEGSEFEILSALDFSSYRFSVVTVEHNSLRVAKEFANCSRAKATVASSRRFPMSTIGTSGRADTPSWRSMMACLHGETGA